MAKITRANQKQFGLTGPTGDFGQFGSLFDGAKTFTKDPATIQSLDNFLNGWGEAVQGGTRPALEDFNSLFLLAFRQIAYMFQEGIPEWETGTEYHTNSIVKHSGQLYVSITDDNTGNTPSATSAFWTPGLGTLNGAVPTGGIIDFAGNTSTIDAGYLLCNGQTVSRTTYSRLFSRISTSFGAGNGSTTFHLPNTPGMVLIPIDGSSNFLTIGQTGGAKTHTLTTSEMPPHTHPYETPAVVAGGGGGEANRFKGTTTGTTSSTGGGAAHNNLQPYLCIGGRVIKT